MKDCHVNFNFANEVMRIRRIMRLLYIVVGVGAAFDVWELVRLLHLLSAYFGQAAR